MIPIDILQLLDRLEQVVSDGWRLPFGKRRFIDADAFRKIIGQMWITVPEAIKRAEQFEEERDRLIARAQQEAERIIAQAREDAAQMLDEHTVRVQAEREAASLTARAEQYSARTRADADEYAERTLRELGEQVEHLGRVIANGVNVLETHRREQAALAERLQEQLTQNTLASATAMAIVTAATHRDGDGEASAAGAE